MTPADASEGVATVARSTAFVLIDRTVWTCAALITAIFLLSIVHQPVGWGPALVLGTLTIVAAWRPFDALLLLAALGPLATMIFVIVRGGDANVRFHEAIALAFLFGFAIHRVVRGPRSSVSPSLYTAAILLLSLLIASGAVGAAIMLAEQPRWGAKELLQELVIPDYLVASDPITAAGLLAEGVLLMVAVASLSAGDARRLTILTRMMVVGAATAASFNVLRIIAVAISREDPWPSFIELLRTLRVNVHFADLNAAGSYFALSLFIAVGLWRSSPILAVLGTVLIAAGLWTSGSRTAMAAVLIVGLASLLFAVRRNSRFRYVAAAAAATLIGIGAVAWAIYPHERNVGADTALSIRTAMAKGAIEMAREAPIFGVGIGRYYILSEKYTLRQHTGPRENAHNNFLQILAELGAAGLVLFLAVILLSLRSYWRSRSSTPVAAGAVAGVGAFLLTCMTGHPLLVAATAYPFWMALGIVAAPAQISSTWSSRATILLVTLVLATTASLPRRLAKAPMEADLENASAGLSLWQRDAGGQWYRWAGGRSTFFAPASTKAVLLPLRRGPAAGGTMEVRIHIAGTPVEPVVLEEAQDWRTVRVGLRPSAPARFVRIDIESLIRGASRPVDAKPTDTTGVLMVGGPIFVAAEMVREDFDADRKTDISVFRPASSAWYVMPSSSGTATSVVWGRGGDVPVPGDYDGDGKTDKAVYRPSSGTWYVLQTTTGTGITIPWNVAGDVLVPEDYDGDGKTDVAVFRPSTGVWYIVESSTGTTLSVPWGQSGDVPVPADFDGDGKADPTVFRPSTGAWYQRRSLTRSVFSVVWGENGDTPVAGDYDGDRIADPTVFRASTGTWYQLRSAMGSGFTVQWGVAGDVPIVGDYDGDEKADPTLFRPSTGIWYQLRSTTGTALAIAWGMSGDVPMPTPSAWPVKTAPR